MAKFITIKEASKMIGVTSLTLRNWDKNGKLKAIRHPMNNYRVYKIEDIEKVVNDIEIGSTKPPVIRPKKPTRKKLVIKHLDY
ncbi:MAG: MerR family DNA-binding transcriptional regulator [Patescibacteria group bacterium]|nr:MerR family DNA-binding transcriptional regulator [Patescibacteria group bacterium]